MILLSVHFLFVLLSVVRLSNVGSLQSPVHSLSATDTLATTTTSLDTTTTTPTTAGDANAKSKISTPKEPRARELINSTNSTNSTNRPLIADPERATGWFGVDIFDLWIGECQGGGDNDAHFCCIYSILLFIMS